MNQIDLSTKTVEELKALAYDQIVQAQTIQNNIIAIQAEITKRDQPAMQAALGMVEKLEK